MTQSIFDAAASLLVDIAGPEAVHIEMSARGPKKYYDVHRVLTAQDARAHLAGRKTCGATLRHPDGLARALCYDADTPDDWLRLLEAAYWLATGSYRPLLEASPIGRGGHLWIIYRVPVKAAWAHRHAAQVAPTLVHIGECWPAAGGHKVRLPGGLYVRPSIRAWCRLYDAQGGLLATDGTSVAHVLLDWQTPADLVPAYPDAGPGPQYCGTAPPTSALPDDSCHAPDNKGEDRRWHEKYSRHFWFQFTPAQLAAWYNERTLVQDILPAEKNGMGLASWRGERTASVGLRADGWVDFGASARSRSGKQDGGDALELEVRVTQETKPEVMRKIARQLVREARHAMESAAWRGEEPPAWLQAFMSLAGWERYHALRVEAGYVVQVQASPEVAQVPRPTRGVAGFDLAPETVQGDTQPHGEGTSQHHKTTSTVLHEAYRGRGTPEALATALGVELGDPCPRCGCSLRYSLEPYLMCYKCHPPRGLSDDHWRQLCTLFPIRLSLQGRKSNV